MTADKNIIEIPNGSKLILPAEAAPLREALLAGAAANESAMDASLANLEANAAAAAANQSREDALALANAAGPTAVVETFAEADALSLSDGDVVQILRDESAHGRRTARTSDGTALGEPVFLDERQIVKMTEWGFVPNDSSASAKVANGTLWAALKAFYSDLPLLIIVDGKFCVPSGGFHLEDRTYPVEFVGTTFGSELYTTDVGTITVRVRGVINGKRCPLVRSRGVVYRGAWNAANGWARGSNPNTNIPGNAGWVLSSPFEVLHCERYESHDDHIYDSEYDGPSMPDGIGSALITNLTASNIADDAINPGGFQQDQTSAVENVEVIGGHIKFCGNVGLHSSGGAFNIYMRDVLVQRCGRAGFDMVNSNVTYENIVVEDIGQPHPSDPEWGNYPGGNGFYNSTPGLPGAHGVIVNISGDRKMRGNKIINCRINRLFDRDGRLQHALDCRPTGNADIAHCDFDLVLDQTGLDHALYDSSNIKLLNTGGANNVRIEHTKMRVKAVNEYETRLGRSDVHHAGDTNEVWIDAGYSSGVQIAGDDLTVRECRLKDGVITVQAARLRLGGVSAENLEELSATAQAIGLLIQGPDLSMLDRPELVNCGISYTATGVRPKYHFGIYYRGAPEQRPLVVNSSFGGDAGVYNGVHLEQEALAAGVSAGNLFINRRPDVKVNGLTGYVNMTSGIVWHKDSASATDCHATGFNLACSTRAVFESVGADRAYYSGLVTSDYTADSEVVIRSQGAIVAMDFQRKSKSTHQCVELVGDIGAVSRGVATGMDGASHSTSGGASNNIELTAAA